MKKLRGECTIFPMCGFAGEFLLSGAKADLATARMMGSRVAHRGPDEESEFLSTDDFLKRKTTIVDYRNVGHHPLTDQVFECIIMVSDNIYVLHLTYSIQYRKVGHYRCPNGRLPPIEQIP